MTKLNALSILTSKAKELWTRSPSDKLVYMKMMDIMPPRILSLLDNGIITTAEIWGIIRDTKP